MAEAFQLSAGEISAAIDGVRISGDFLRVVDGFSIDTRTLAAGDLYFAIRGERLDGHAFLTEALQRGACGVVVSEVPAALLAGHGQPAPLVVKVADTTRALQALARHVRRRSGAQVVAVTGSAGKTTTKEVSAEFLEEKYRVFRNRGNLNNHIGLPLSLLALRHGPEVAVVELGMNHAGEIRLLIDIAEPEVRVWTNVGEAHLEHFASVDAIADAKGEVLEGAAPHHVLVANAEDARVMQRASDFRGRIVTFGVGRDADVAATDVRELGLDGVEALVRTPAGDATVRTPLLGRGSFANVLAATAVALTLQVPLSAIVARAAALKPPMHRGEVLRLGGVWVLDDSYNSNPLALETALGIVRQETRAARRIGVIGEMLELGEASIALHARCGRLAAAAGLDALIAVGGAPARALADAAVTAGMRAAAVSHVTSSDEAAARALALVRPGDLVLVKGSRGIRTDVVVERLRAELG